MLLSVIIPVYRVEHTLKRCVNSVLAQDYQPMEIILVDDGSPDACGAICDQLASRHNQIRVIHQANKGLSGARNTGITHAKGSYITFVDSDDWLATNTYLPLMQLLASNPHYDILEFPIFMFAGNASKEYKQSFGNQEYTDSKQYWLKAKAYHHTYAWNKIYKKNLFQHIRFDEGKVFEDAIILPQLIQQAQCIATTNKGCYHYFDNNQGITAQAAGKEHNILLQTHLKWMQQWCDKDYYATILNIQLQVYIETGNAPILPLRNYWGTWKLNLLHLIGLQQLCRLIKWIQPITQKRR